MLRECGHCLFSNEILVGLGIHQAVELRGIAELDLNNPVGVRVFVDQTGLIVFKNIINCSRRSDYTSKFLSIRST